MIFDTVWGMERLKKEIGMKRHYLLLKWKKAGYPVENK